MAVGIDFYRTVHGAVLSGDPKCATIPWSSGPPAPLRITARCSGRGGDMSAA